MKTLLPFIGRLPCLAFFTLLSILANANDKFPGGVSGRSRVMAGTTASAATKAIFRRPDLGRSNFRRPVLHRTGSRRLELHQLDLRRSHSEPRRSERQLVGLEALSMFNEMKLKDSGLDEQALECGLLGYYRLLKQGVLHRTDVLSICDFSQSSSLRRLYVIDVVRHRLLYRTYVAHGIRSGSEYANSFSNSSESHKSSLGFYITRETYFGANGLSLRIDGVDRGFNSMARRRAIVIHGAPYVSEHILSKYGVMGTTFGCPAIPEEMTTEIIPVVKGGTCFFIYYPSKEYLSKSVVLNG